MSVKIQLRRGVESNLPTLSTGEPGFTTDTHKLFIGTDSGNIQIGISNVLIEEVTQTNHGFNDDFIYHNGTQWVKAIADETAHTATHFAVPIDSNTFQLICMGEIDSTGMTDDQSNALTDGEYYFLSQTTAGKITKTKPSTGVVQSVLKTNGTNSATILISNPVEPTTTVDGGAF